MINAIDFLWEKDTTLQDIVKSLGPLGELSSSSSSSSSSSLFIITHLVDDRGKLSLFDRPQTVRFSPHFRPRRFEQLSVSSLGCEWQWRVRAHHLV